MFMGKCKTALDLLSRGEKGRILHLNDHVNPDDPLSPTVRELLVQKHPVGQPAYSLCIVPDEPQDSHPVIFESLDANAENRAVLLAAGILRCSVVILRRPTGTMHTNVRIALPRFAVHSKYLSYNILAHPVHSKSLSTRLYSTKNHAVLEFRRHNRHAMYM